jgi:hypothetical protein
MDVTIDASKVNNLASTIDARLADVTVKSLSATDETSTVTVNSDGITIKPTSSTTSISLNKNGSGNIASGNISWNTDGEITIKDPKFSTTGQSGNTVNVSTVLCTDVNASGTVNTQDLYAKEIHLDDLNVDSSSTYGDRSFTTGISLVSGAVVATVYVDNQGYLRILQGSANDIYSSLT